MKLFALSLTLLALPTLAFAAPTSKTKPKPTQKVKPQQKVDTTAYWSSQVLGPRFYLQSPKEKIEAGSAYLATHPRTGAPILCTVMHLLGPAGGMDRQLSFVEASKRVEGVLAVNDNGKIKVLAAGVATKNGHASTENEEFSAMYDFIAFRVAKKTEATPFKFARSIPKIGETVWILGPRSYSARVAGMRADGLYLETAGQPEFRGYSGCPIINAKGEVVASLVGSTGNYIMACPLNVILSLLG